MMWQFFYLNKNIVFVFRKKRRIKNFTKVFSKKIAVIEKFINGEFVIFIYKSSLV